MISPSFFGVLSDGVDGVIALGASMQSAASAASAARNAAEPFDRASISQSDNSGENPYITMRTSCPFWILSFNFF